MLSCRKVQFGIYYTINQIIKQSTNFVQKRTPRTKLHKIVFCTHNEPIVQKRTMFRADINQL
nr:MAG TPA: hypothetical protein [Caudoviricetes sp.]